MALTKATIKTNCDTLTNSFVAGDIAGSDVKSDLSLRTALANLAAQLDELLRAGGVGRVFMPIDLTN